ncbi:MAG: zinc ribbon domain-containing protein, partial [Bacillota bacterium]|nr:zinc ribbon domain-containing protein [Bacillota bacterium]
LAFIFKDKITLAYEYNKAEEMIKHNKVNAETLKPGLTSIANKSSDIVDILILNNQNNIVFSAKNSSLAKSGHLELSRSSGEKNHYLTDNDHPDIVFMLLKRDNLKALKYKLGGDNEFERGYSDEYFHEKNFNDKKVYLLSYIANKPSGDKIYFITDIRAIPNGELYMKIIAAAAMLFFMLYWVIIALWIYANALKAKLNASIWGITALFTNLAGLFVYLIYKQGNQVCYKCGAIQNKTNKYCTFCGTKINKCCEKCNTVINDKDFYCKNCGNLIK